ncbi:alpha/beta-hydrolase [Trichodelitschia bisporula]|uniref:Alpha/beta-hydrolase n=1 Tax=Trichodelitschia bisporula TaxID=703511 RepID=A0A6G1I6P5_9PEZI|nr:alpha/beta-hydrolase [Trichodelitschia bisporula]
MRLTAVLLFVSAALAVPAQKACSPVELIWARATTEAAGLGIVGAPLVKATQRLIPGFTYYAVKYPADMSSSSPDKGVADMLNRINGQATACPQQKFVLGGYSQGAVVCHRAAVKMSKDVLSRIIATATFGDGGQQATKAKPVYDSPVGPIPRWPDELDGRIKFNCNKGDLTCTPGGTSTLAHMQYTSGKFIPESAQFIAEQWKKLGGGGAGAAVTARHLAIS